MYIGTQSLSFGVFINGYFYVNHQIVELVIDNIYPDEIPYPEWAHDYGVNKRLGIEVTTEKMTGGYNDCIPTP